MHFRFLNIPVHIHPTFWLFLLFFTNLNFSIESIILAGVLLLSLLVHEYGHALTAAYFGARPQITLEAFGGYARYNGARMTTKQHFLITLNGPLLESLLIALSYYLLKTHLFDDNHYIHYFLTATFRLNVIWCLLNLIPVAPLDGGYLLRYLLQNKFGYKGRNASIYIGIICTALLAPYLLIHKYYFFGTLLLIYAFQNYQQLQKTKDPKTLLKKLLKSKQAPIRTSALESLAKIHLEENNPQKSYNLLLTADPEHLKEGKLLLCNLAFQHKNYPLVTKYAYDLYTLDPSLETALLISKSHAALNQPQPALAWLETASQFDQPLHHALQDPLYNPLRNDPTFQDFVEKLTQHI